MGKTPLPATAPSPAPGGRVQLIEPCIKSVEVSCSSNSSDITYTIEHASLTYTRYADVSVTCTTNFVYGWCDLGGNGGTGGWGDLIAFKGSNDLTDYSASNKGGSTAGNREPTPSPVVVVEGRPGLLNTILNDVQNPCLKRQVNNAISEDAINDIRTIINDKFNINDDVNLHISESSSLNQTDDGTTSVDRRGDYLDVFIELNLNTLPTSSQEYILATIYHEFVHAILRYNNIPGSQQHQDMADQYISKLTTALLSKFPNTPQQDAIDLAWGGLQYTDAWKKLGADTIRIKNTNYDYKKRTNGKGTKCSK